MKKGRLHLRIPEELADNVKAYAERHGTTVSDLVRQYLVDLLNQESWKKPSSEDDVEQI